MQPTTPSRRAAEFDRARRGVFLDKADIALPDAALAALRSAPDASLGIDEALLRDALSAFGIDASAPLSSSGTQGTFHRLYEVSEPGRAPRVLRIAALSGEAAADAMALECRVMAALAARGLRVPACAYREVSRAGAVRGVHLVDLVPGSSLTALDEDEERMQAALGHAARFLASLHRIGGAGFGPLSLEAFAEGDARARPVGVHSDWPAYLLVRLQDHLSACEAAGAITIDEKRRIAALFAAGEATLRSAPPALLHGDPGSHNFMGDASALRAVVDWEDALLGDPLFDLASLCTFHPERRHDAIRAAYGAAIEPGGDGWIRFWLYFLRIALAKTVHRRRFAYADTPGRAPASQRIQLALRRLEGERSSR